MDFFWTAPQSLEHAVTFTTWNTGLLVPSALSPVAYAYTVGASGLVEQPIATVSGMSGGFVGSGSDASDGAWLVGYHGDVTYLGPAGDGAAYPLPTSVSGAVFVGTTMYDGAPYFVTATGDIFTVYGEDVTQVTPGFGEPVSSLSSNQSALYAVLPDSGNLAVLSLDTAITGSLTKISVPMQAPAFVVASDTGIAVGGASNSTLPIGAIAFASDPSFADSVAAVNTATNQVYLLTGPEPDWSVNSAVSGTGHPVAVTWASSGEQVLVADTVSGVVEVFNLVAGVLVPEQTVAVSGVMTVAATPDGLSAIATQPSSNQVSILANTANLWAVASSVSIVGARCAVAISNTEFLIGGSGSVSWLQVGNNGWIVTDAVSGLAFTPSSMALDGTGIVYATGTASDSGYLVAIGQDTILATTSWSGAGEALVFDQDQIAVADSANSLIRVFGYQGGALVQQGTVAAPSGVKTIGSTPPSLWACGPTEMRQFVFTAPFELDNQPLGVFAIYRDSGWVSGATGVLNQPTAAAWDVSGSVWAATQKDMLYRFNMSAVSVSGITLTPYRANSQVPIGISKMLWWNNGLFAVSSLNSALLGVSGSASPGTPGVVPGVLLGIDFVLGESFYQ